MKSRKILLSISIAAFVVSLIALIGVSMYYFQNVGQFMTGRATDTATVNLTVESVAAINFTVDNINWGSGRVTLGQSSATLNTAINGAGNVTNGNWTGNTRGLNLTNIGNTNVTIFLKTGKNATNFIGGTNPAYQYNVSSMTGACIYTTGFTPNVFVNVNNSQTGDGTAVCDSLRYTEGNRTMRIDIRLVIPSDSRTGALGDVITATAAENSTA